jgi:site-specific recombinase XerD
MTLQEAFDLYCQEYIEYNNQSAKTEENHYVCLRSLLEYFGNIQIKSLTVQHVRKWKSQLDKQHSSTTVRNYIIKLRVVLKWLKMEGYPVISVDRLEVPKRVKKVAAFVEPEDIDALIEANGAQKVRVVINRVRNKAIISLLYSSGIRLSECSGLDRSDMKPDGTFTVIGKGGKPRLCFVDERTKRYINEYLKMRTKGYKIMWSDRGKATNRVRKVYQPDNEAPLFLGNQTGLRITPGGIQEIIKNSRKNAGITSRVTPHTLRHSFATNLLRNNCNIRYVQEFLGHESLETTQMYTHIVNNDLKEAHKKFHTS